MTTTLTDLEQRLARVEQLITHCHQCRAALRAEDEERARALRTAVRALQDPAERAAAWLALPDAERKHCLDLAVPELAAFLDGFEAKTFDAAIGLVPYALREPTMIRFKSVPARVRVTLHHEAKGFHTAGLSVAEHPRLKRLREHDLSRYVDPRDLYYLGFKLDHALRPTFTREAWDLLLSIDGVLRSIAKSGQILVEELDEAASAEALLAEWATHGIPEDQRLPALPWASKGSKRRAR